VTRAEVVAGTERHPYRWVIFGAMCGVYFAFGVVLLAIPPMVTEVRTELGISRSVLGFALGAWALMYIVTAPPAGRIIDRIGLHRSLAVGSLLIAVSASVQAAAQGVVMLWIAIAIIGIGGPLVSLSAPKLVAVWFSDRSERPLAVGLFTSAPALGGVFALLLTNTVLLPLLGSWRSVLMFEAALNLLAVSVWVVVSGRAPSEPVDTDAVLAPTPPGVGTARVLLSSAAVRLAMVLGIGSFFITQGLSAWLPSILEEHSGLSVRVASLWAAASLAVGILARLVIPGLARPERRSAVLYAVMFAIGAAMVLMAVGPAGTHPVAALVMGLRLALSSLVIVVLMEADAVTAANAGLAYGLWFSAVEVGGALGPPVVGAFGDSGLGYPGALVVMAVLLVLMVAVLFRDDHRHHRRRTTPRASATS
jgi:MFS transporter, CP family, cyanate transporter